MCFSGVSARASTPSEVGDQSVVPPFEPEPIFFWRDRGIPGQHGNLCLRSDAERILGLDSLNCAGFVRAVGLRYHLALMPGPVTDECHLEQQCAGKDRDVILRMRDLTLF